jgi:hypothetical protein
MDIKDLKFNMAALKEFKSITGESPFNADYTDPEIYSALVYVGLRQGKYKTEGVTQEEVDEDLDYNDLPLVIKAFEKSWSRLAELGEKK